MQVTIVVCFFLFCVQPTWTEEMSQGLFVEDDKDVDEADSDGEYEGVPAAAVRAVDRKTKQQRRKEKEKEEEVSIMSWMNGGD